jgi:hypothetical protein
MHLTSHLITCTQRNMNVTNSSEMVGHIPAVLAALLAPVMDAYPERDFRVEGACVTLRVL